MDEDLETFGPGMRVEVCVSAGGLAGVSLTTVVALEDSTERTACVSKLRDAITLLRMALPLEELKYEEGAFVAASKDTNITALNKNGQPVSIPKNLRVILAEQEKLKQALGEKSDGSSEGSESTAVPKS